MGKKLNIANMSLKSPFATATVIEQTFALKLLKPYLEKGMLENCSNCSMIKRIDSWCSCDVAEKARQEAEKQQAPKPSSKPKRGRDG